MNKGNQHSIINFDSSTDYRSLKKEFQTNNKINGIYHIFSGSAEINYLNSVQDTDYALTIHYYQKIQNSVYFTYPSSKSKILTDLGKEIYDDGNNPNFRFLCGDYLISNYEEGAGLVISIIVNFKSNADKKNFEFKSDASLGPFANIIHSLNRDLDKLHIKARIRITGFQFGGNPEELSKILSGYTSSCDVQKLNDCSNIVNQLVSYTADIFPNQFKKSNEGIWENLFINTGKIQKLYSLSEVGLTLSDSFVTTELHDARKEITTNYLKLKYYSKEMLEISKYFRDCAINWSELILKADMEIDIFNSAEDMFFSPNRGMEVYNSVKKRSNAEKLLEEIEKNLADIRYEVVYDDESKTTVYSKGKGYYGCYFKTSNSSLGECKATSFGNFSIYVPLLFEVKAECKEVKEENYDDDIENDHIWKGYYDMTVILPFIHQKGELKGYYYQSLFYVKKYELTLI